MQKRFSIGHAHRGWCWFRSTHAHWGGPYQPLLGMLECARKLLQSPRAGNNSSGEIPRQTAVTCSLGESAVEKHRDPAKLDIEHPSASCFQKSTQLLLWAMGANSSASTILFRKQRGATKNWSLACVHKADWKSQDVGSWSSWIFVKSSQCIKTLHLCCYVHIWEERPWLVAGRKSPKARLISSAQTCRRSREMIMSFASFWASFREGPSFSPHFTIPLQQSVGLELNNSIASGSMSVNCADVGSVSGQQMDDVVDYSVKCKDSRAGNKLQRFQVSKHRPFSQRAQHAQKLQGHCESSKVHIGTLWHRSPCFAIHSDETIHLQTTPMARMTSVTLLGMFGTCASTQPTHQ